MPSEFDALTVGDVCGSDVDRLLGALSDLARARTLDDAMRVVRRAARDLAEADGATFVVRDRDQCFYADEDAIAPLWKGRRFPMDACVSGWVMRYRQPAVIPDIYGDPRVPAAAYRPTFVRSLAMVPIRRADPLGAIGVYWAAARRASPREVALLGALADGAALAVENAELLRELEARVRERTARDDEVRPRLDPATGAQLRDLLRQVESLADVAGASLRGGDLGGVESALQRLAGASRSAIAVVARAAPGADA